MHHTTQASGQILDSKWPTGALLAAAALLISPTFVLGYFASTPWRAALLGLGATAYGLVFHTIFEGRTPVGVEEVTTAYRSLALWTAVIGSAFPFIAGAMFRRAWNATAPRQASMLVVAAFSTLAAGSHLVTEKTDALAAASNIAVGKSQALSALEAEAAAISTSRPDTPEAWTARFIASKIAGELLGIGGPQFDDFVRRLNVDGKHSDRSQ